MIAWGSLLLSLIAPGAGHIALGNYVQGCAIGVLFALGKSALLPLSLRMLNIHDLRKTYLTFYVCNWMYILVILYAASSAFVMGWDAHETHFWAAIIFAVCEILVYKRTQNKFIFTLLCARTGVWEILQRVHKSPTEKLNK